MELIRVNFQFSMLRLATYAGRPPKTRIPVSEREHLRPFKFYFPDSTYPKETVSIYIAVLEHLPNERDIDSRKQVFLTAFLMFSETVWTMLFVPLYPLLQFSSNEVKMLLDFCNTSLKQSFWDRAAVSHP